MTLPRRLTLLVLVLLLALTALPAVASEDAELIQVPLLFQEEPVLLEPGQGFFVRHGHVVGECEDGEPTSEAAAGFEDDNIRIDLFLDGVPVEETELQTFCGVFGDAELALKFHYFEFPDGLPEGTYTLTGIFYSYDDEGHVHSVEHSVELHVVAGPTEDDPVHVFVHSPHNAEFNLQETTTVAPPGWAIAPLELDIDADPATPEDPHIFELHVHPSLFAWPHPGRVHLLRDGALVDFCVEEEASTADPDPCVADRFMDDRGIIIFTVLTSEASLWSFISVEPVCQDYPLPFDDVNPDSVHASSIACVAHHEVTGGFGDGTYRPGQVVRRGQMASFVVAALGAAGHELPPATDQGFTDVAGVHAPAINRLVAAGIVSGTSSTTFNPSGIVSRGHMASFLTGAVRWAWDMELAAEFGPHFTDTEGHVHAGNIDLAFELGLAGGIGGGLFAPSDPTRRSAMASFLVNLMEVVWLEPPVG